MSTLRRVSTTILLHLLHFWSGFDVQAGGWNGLDAQTTGMRFLQRLPCFLRSRERNFTTSQSQLTYACLLVYTILGDAKETSNSQESQSLRISRAVNDSCSQPAAKTPQNTPFGPLRSQFRRRRSPDTSLTHLRVVSRRPK